MSLFKTLFCSFRKIWLLFTYKFKKPRITVTGAFLSGNGSFVDIRYHLSRPDKARGRFPIYLIDEGSGEKLFLMNLARFGAVRTKHNKNNYLGVLLFRNRYNTITPGSTVALVFGTLQVKNVVIRS